jgi:catechol 2,3-dioxygenase-like lactoylglutathione lyase family enzyme
MRKLNYLLLAVRDPLASAELYTRLLGSEPVEKSAGFVLYVLPGGLRVGLWRKDEIEPAPRPAGGIEISFTEASREAVQATYAEWTGLGLKVQQPTDMDFGFTFVVEDPDGHRLRPFALDENPR